jgi:5-methyltetrahydrofolate--homocysteine methyltransferase
MNSSDPRDVLSSLLRERILVLDGAMGTMIQARGFGEADYRGERFRDHSRDLRGDSEILVLTQPDAIREIHEAFLAVGADIVETNTFGSTRVGQAEYGTTGLVHELNVAAARLAREAADAWTARTPDRPARSGPPTRRSPSRRT